MINVLVQIVCSLQISLTPSVCIDTISKCIENDVQMRYEESRWLDVPNNEMRLEALKTCTEWYIED